MTRSPPPRPAVPQRASTPDPSSRSTSSATGSTPRVKSMEQRTWTRAAPVVLPTDSVLLPPLPPTPQLDKMTSADVKRVVPACRDFIVPSELISGARLFHSAKPDGRADMPIDSPSHQLTPRLADGVSLGCIRALLLLFLLSPERSAQWRGQLCKWLEHYSTDTLGPLNDSDELESHIGVHCSRLQRVTLNTYNNRLARGLGKRSAEVRLGALQTSGSMLETMLVLLGNKDVVPLPENLACVNCSIQGSVCFVAKDDSDYQCAFRQKTPRRSTSDARALAEWVEAYTTIDKFHKDEGLAAVFDASYIVVWRFFVAKLVPNSEPELSVTGRPLRQPRHSGPISSAITVEKTELDRLRPIGRQTLNAVHDSSSGHFSTSAPLQGLEASSSGTSKSYVRRSGHSGKTLTDTTVSTPPKIPASSRHDNLLPLSAPHALPPSSPSTVPGEPTALQSSNSGEQPTSGLTQPLRNGHATMSRVATPLKRRRESATDPIGRKSVRFSPSLAGQHVQVSPRSGCRFSSESSSPTPQVGPHLKDGRNDLVRKQGLDQFGAARSEGGGPQSTFTTPVVPVLRTAALSDESKTALLSHIDALCRDSVQDLDYLSFLRNQNEECDVAEPFLDKKLAKPQAFKNLMSFLLHAYASQEPNVATARQACSDIATRLQVATTDCTTATKERDEANNAKRAATLEAQHMMDSLDQDTRALAIIAMDKVVASKKRLRLAEETLAEQQRLVESLHAEAEARNTQLAHKQTEHQLYSTALTDVIGVAKAVKATVDVRVSELQGSNEG